MSFQLERFSLKQGHLEFCHGAQDFKSFIYMKEIHA